MIRQSIYFLTIICFGISGCAFTPSQTYEELGDEAAITKDYTKVEAFEANAIKAEQFFQTKMWCESTKECIWICVHHGTAPRYRRGDEWLNDIDELVRRWRRVRTACGPGTREDVERMFSL